MPPFGFIARDEVFPSEVGVLGSDLLGQRTIRHETTRPGSQGVALLEHDLSALLRRQPLGYQALIEFAHAKLAVQVDGSGFGRRQTSSVVRGQPQVRHRQWRIAAAGIRVGKRRWNWAFWEGPVINQLDVTVVCFGVRAAGIGGLLPQGLLGGR
ncbi:hypothetical protein BEL07_08320 [Mycolicibacterium grossiae]|uniref:Uncharacterized protein n=1 Tax=Mycolicibacterium grossiae TaxID=1552759 RepID=A0A1E8Q8G7_9MYCO|nr:hypothetical protein BEL07_08320 [Mycolicibacterium grossiae]